MIANGEARGGKLLHLKCLPLVMSSARTHGMLLAGCLETKELASMRRD